MGERNSIKWGGINSTKNNVNIYDQQLTQYQTKIQRGPPHHPLPMNNANNSNKWMNFNENKYKLMHGPTAQSKIAKVLQRKGRNTAMSVDRRDLCPQPFFPQINVIIYVFIFRMSRSLKIRLKI